MPHIERKRDLKAVFWFLLINFIFSVILNYSYILFSPDTKSIPGTLFIHTALVSNVVMLYAAVLLFLSIPMLLTRKATVILSLSILTISMLHILNSLDIIIFHIFRYHINSMVLVLVFTEGVRDSLHIGLGTVLTFLFIAVALVVLEIYLMRYCRQRLSLFSSTARIAVTFIILALASVFMDKISYAVSDLYNVNDITRCTKIFPLYQRVTVMHFMKDHLGFQVDREDGFSPRMNYSSLSYPLAEIEHTKKKDLPNVIFILIDAWRFDMLNQDVSPNITRFSKDAVVFRNHYSGGNASRFGVFTLIYGVYGSYWHSFLAERRSPVLLDELMKLGYDFKILASTKMTNPEFRKTAFVKLSGSIMDELPGSMAEQRDPELAKTFIDWIGQRKGAKPFFAFLFFDAPHGPYVYPKEFEKFKPSNKSPNYVTTSKKDAVPLFNSYKNAICFDDYQVGKVLAEIKRQGLDKNSIILITGDHGEEFFEAGNWGHTSDFSKYQSKVPLVMSIPGVPPGEIRSLTSHLDIVSTVLDALGSSTSSQKYSQGFPLFSGMIRGSVLVAGWDDCAIIDDEYTIVLPFESYNAGGYEVRAAEDYRLVRNEKDIFKQKKDAIREVMQGMSIFLK